MFELCILRKRWPLEASAEEMLGWAALPLARAVALQACRLIWPKALPLSPDPYVKAPNSSGPCKHPCPIPKKRKLDSNTADTILPWLRGEQSFQEPLKRGPRVLHSATAGGGKLRSHGKNSYRSSNLCPKHSLPESLSAVFIKHLPHPWEVSEWTSQCK